MSCDSPDPAAVDDLRHFIYLSFAADGEPPSFEAMRAKFGLDADSLRALLNLLEERKQLVRLAGTDRILMAHPFAAIATGHRIEAADGRCYSSPCIWDGLAIHWTIDGPISIETHCVGCAAPVAITVDDAHAVRSDPEAQLHFGKPARLWWDDVIDTCCNSIRLVCDTCFSDVRGGETVSLPTALAIGRPIYAEKLRYQYRRPAAEQIEAAFAQAGLTSAFWRF